MSRFSRSSLHASSKALVLSLVHFHDRLTDATLLLIFSVSKQPHSIFPGIKQAENDVAASEQVSDSLCPSMRSVIICLLSLFLVPAFGDIASPWDHVLPSLSTHPPSGMNRPSNRLPFPPIPLPSTHQPPIHQPSTHQPSTHQPSIHQPPTHPRPLLPPPHGNMVAFQTNTGPHPGMITGSHPDQQGKFTVTPTKIFGNILLGYPNTVMKVHPNDMLITNVRVPGAASDIVDHHTQYPPTKVDITAPVYGSRNYVAPHGPRMPGNRRQR